MFILFCFSLNTSLFSQCPSASPNVGGYAWEDWNFNGTQDENCIIPICGLEVEIWSCDDMLIGTTTTDANGDWTYNLTGMPTCDAMDDLCDGTFANNCIRVEYTLPDNLCHYKFTQVGPDNGTSVQFIKPGDCAPIGLARPEDYCEDNNPTLLTSCFSTLRPESTTNEPAIVSWDYNDTADQNYSTAAYFDDVGAIWGIAYNNEAEQWYYASFVKRHVGLGTDGIGAIYTQSDLSNPGTVSTFYDFGAAAGSIGSNVARGLPTNLGEASYDTDAFAKTGKEGLGDIEYSSHTDMLYVVNLFDRTVYQLDPNATTPTAVSLGTMPWISNSPCTNGTARPWALKTHNKKLYVGVVCDASNGFESNLTAHMYCYDFRTNSWNSSPRLSFDLDYERQPSNANPDGSPSNNSYNGAQWHPWEDNYNNWNDFQSYGSYAQPIFSDIEFDDNGDVILGFMDRGSLQMGHDNYRPGFPYGPGGGTRVSYINAGDVLRAGMNDKSTDPTFTIENDGITNGVHKTKTSSRSRIDQTSNSPSQTINQVQDSGPGGREFYWGERGLLHHDDGFRADHLETALGALALLRGSGEVIATVMDPQYRDYPAGTMGIHFLNNDTGYWNDAKLLARNGNTSLNKSIALGDIELCCLPPPIQVGNFLWVDLDMDGIQDPCEPGLAGVTVSIYADDGAGCCTLITSTTTDADGQYYFDVLDPNTTYHIVVGGNGGFNTTDQELTVGADAYELTGANQTQAGNTSDPDNVDSDGIISSNACCANGYPSTTVTTGDPGDMDHSLDFGFVPVEQCGEPSCYGISVIRN